MAYGTESIRPVDVIVGPGNVYVAVAKREVAGEGRVGVPSAFAGPSEVVVVADDSVDADLAAVDVILQAEHGPGGLAWLVTWDEAVADAVVDRDRRAGGGVAPRGPTSRRRSPRAGTRSWSTGPSRRSRSPTSSRPSTSSCCADDPASLVRGVRHAGAVFCGPWAPASVGDYIAGPSHVLPTDGSARFGSALTVSRLHQARPRHHPRPRGARSRSARTSRRWPRPRASTPTPTRSAAAGSARHDGRTTERLAPRDDVALMEGYHSPQVDVAVRLNTNESPVPPPAAFRERAGRRAGRPRRGTATPTGPRSSCGPPSARSTASGPSRCSRPTARTRCSRRSASPTAGPVARSRCSSRRTRCTATSPASPAPRCVVGERTDDFALDLAEVDRVLAGRPGDHVPVLAEQPDRAGRAAGGRRGGARAGPGPGRGRRGLRAVRAVVRARAGRRGRAAGRHPHVLQDVVDGRGPARLPGRARLGGRRAREGRAAVPPRRGQAGRRPARAALHRRDGGAGGRAGRGAGPAVRRARRPRRRRVAVGRQLRAVPAPVRATATTVWQALLDRSVLVRNCASWPRLDGCLRVTIGTRAEDDAFLQALEEVL